MAAARPVRSPGEQPDHSAYCGAPGCKVQFEAGKRMRELDRMALLSRLTALAVADRTWADRGSRCPGCPFRQYVSNRQGLRQAEHLGAFWKRQADQEPDTASVSSAR